VFGSREASEGGRAVVNWTGVQFEVPVGWYDVPVCFMTGSTAPPIGYLTTQPPHAQCDDSHCGPPIDEVGASDVLVMALQSSTSLVRPIRPDTTVAGRPAQLRTSPGENQFGADQILEEDVLLPHHQVLLVTAYLGTAASPERQRFLAMIRNARLRTPTDLIGAPR
jgi:hypothetical protein